MPETLNNLGFDVALDLYLQDCTGRGFSQATIEGKRNSLELFFRWCRENDLLNIDALDSQSIREYRNSLPVFKQPYNGRMLTRGSQRNRLITVKMFFQFLVENEWVYSDPAKSIELPRPVRTLPRDSLTFAEAEQILQSIDLNAVLGIRDRAILETFFATGIRRMELANLSVQDVNHATLMIFVKSGKGGKDRYIPMARRTSRWNTRYMIEARPTLKSDHTMNCLFIDSAGKRMRGHQLTRIASKHIRKSGVRDRGACHLFRHTLARLMLENGADIRFIQEMLGHADISTTQIYTHVAIPQLKEVYARTFPAAMGDKNRSPI